IADDDHHVSIFRDLPFIAQTSMAWDDHRSAFLTPRDGFIENVVERCNLASDAAAGLYINEWITCGIKDIACDDDIRTAEVHNAVSVRRCIGLMENFNCFTIVQFSPPALDICVGRPAVRWYWSYGAGRANAF